MEPIKAWAILHHHSYAKKIFVSEILHDEGLAKKELEFSQREYSDKHTLHEVTITEGWGD